MGFCCCVPGCVSYRCKKPKEMNVKYFPLPTNEVLRKIWLTNMRGTNFEFFPNAKSPHVCSLHFENEAFAGNRQSYTSKLKRKAIPTKFKWPVKYTQPVLKYDSDSRELINSLLEKRTPQPNENSSQPPPPTLPVDVTQGHDSASNDNNGSSDPLEGEDDEDSKEDLLDKLINVPVRNYAPLKTYSRLKNDKDSLTRPDKDSRSSLGTDVVDASSGFSVTKVDGGNGTTAAAYIPVINAKGRATASGSVLKDDQKGQASSGSVLKDDQKGQASSGSVVKVDKKGQVASGSVAKVDQKGQVASGSVAKVDQKGQVASGSGPKVDRKGQPASGSVAKVDQKGQVASGSGLKVDHKGQAASGSVAKVDQKGQRASGSVAKVDRKGTSRTVGNQASDDHKAKQEVRKNQQESIDESLEENFDINDYLQCTLDENPRVEGAINVERTEADEEDDIEDVNQFLQCEYHEENSTTNNHHHHPDEDKEAPEAFSCLQANFQDEYQAQCDEFSLMQKTLNENQGHLPQNQTVRRPSLSGIFKSGPSTLEPSSTLNAEPELQVPSSSQQRMQRRQRATRITIEPRPRLNSPGKSLALATRDEVLTTYVRQDKTSDTPLVKIIREPRKRVPTIKDSVEVQEGDNVPPEKYRCLQTKPAHATAIAKINRIYVKSENESNSVAHFETTEKSKTDLKVCRSSSDESSSSVSSDTDDPQLSTDGDDEDTNDESTFKMEYENGPSNLRFYRATDINYYTGFESFKHLMTFYEMLTDETDEALEANRDGDLEFKKLLRIEELMMVLTRLRLNPNEKVLGDLFGVYDAYVTKVLKTWIPFLARKLTYLPMWPSRAEVDRTTPKIILETYPHLRVLVDCVEFLVEDEVDPGVPVKPKVLLKAVVGVSPVGRVVRYSSVFRGDRTTLEGLVLESGILDALDEGDLILSGHTFNNLKAELDARNVSLSVPAFLSVPDELLPKIDHLGVDEIMKLHLRKSLKKLREFKIFSREVAIPSTLTPMSDYIFIVCCYLANFMTQTLS